MKSVLENEETVAADKGIELCDFVFMQDGLIVCCCYHIIVVVFGSTVQSNCSQSIYLVNKLVMNKPSFLTKFNEEVHKWGGYPTTMK